MVVVCGTVVVVDWGRVVEVDVLSFDGGLVVVVVGDALWLTLG